MRPLYLSVRLAATVMTVAAAAGCMSVGDDDGGRAQPSHSADRRGGEAGGGDSRGAGGGPGVGAAGGDVGEGGGGRGGGHAGGRGGDRGVVVEDGEDDGLEE
ncbi:hypothetical protein P1S61_39535, partial [Streptomyces sp. ME08-AFT2]|nr:hypothetical protein [Streptomyces sp. ME08-AFT2]